MTEAEVAAPEGANAEDAFLYEDRGPMELPVPLSEGERISRGAKLADLEVSREEKQAALKLATAGARKEVSLLAAEIRQLYQSIAKGTEDRQVPCRNRIDVKRSLKETIRLDTNEVVHSVTLTGTELYNYRQTSIPGANGAAAEAADDPFADEDGAADGEKPKGKRKRRTTTRI